MAHSAYVCVSLMVSTQIKRKARGKGNFSKYDPIVDYYYIIEGINVILAFLK